MKKIAILFLLMSFFFSCSNKGFKKTEDGIIVYVQDSLGTHSIRLQVISDKIIHITSGNPKFTLNILGFLNNGSVKLGCFRENIEQWKPAGTYIKIQERS